MSERIPNNPISAVPPPDAPNSVPENLEKTEKRKELIARSNRLIGKEFSDLGIERRFNSIPAEKIHFVDGRTFERLKPGDDSLTVCGGYFDAETGDVYVPEGNGAGAEAGSLLHEMLHAASILEKDLAVSPDEGKKSTSLRRLGYLSWDPVSRRDSFGGLNEAVVEKARREISSANFNDSFSDSPENNGEAPYDEEVALLDKIIEAVSKHKNADVQEIWRGIKRGLFTGETSQLKIIDEAYGEGALKILGLLGSKFFGSEEEIGEGRRLRLSVLIEDFFGSDEPEERKRIAEKIFGLSGIGI